MRKINKEGLDLIKKYEGLKLKAYICPAGVLTIGYGHTKTVKEGHVIDEDMAERLLEQDLLMFEQGVSKLVKVPITHNMFSALVSFAFNLGLGNLKSSTLLKKVNAGDFDGAAKEFGKWVSAGGKKLPGLVKRRDEEALLFKTGMSVLRME